MFIIQKTDDGVVSVHASAEAAEEEKEFLEIVDPDGEYLIKRLSV